MLELFTPSMGSFTAPSNHCSAWHDHGPAATITSSAASTRSSPASSAYRTPVTIWVAPSSPPVSYSTPRHFPRTTVSPGSSPGGLTRSIILSTNSFGVTCAVSSPQPMGLSRPTDPSSHPGTMSATVGFAFLLSRRLSLFGPGATLITGSFR